MNAVERLAAAMSAAYPDSPEEEEWFGPIYYTTHAEAILAADSELASALETGLSLAAVEAALPDGSRLTIYQTDTDFAAQVMRGADHVATGHGPTPAEALQALLALLSERTDER